MPVGASKREQIGDRGLESCIVFRHQGSSTLVMISSARWQVIQCRMKTWSILSATDPLEKLIEWLLPASLGLRVHQLIVTSNELMLIMASSRSEACCPLCKQKTERMHSRSTRTLQDLPWGTLRVQLQVQVHRFFCQNPTCPRKITTRAAS
jgi:hypothetical protein